MFFFDKHMHPDDWDADSPRLRISTSPLRRDGWPGSAYKKPVEVALVNVS